MDPYQILGVSSAASDDDVKKAYRQQCKRYHPDLHPDDPSAEEKFKQVQAAYEQVMKMRQGGGASSGYGGGYGGYQQRNPYSNGYGYGSRQQQNDPFGFGGFNGFFYGPFGFGYTTGGNRGSSYGYGGAYGPSSAQDNTVELQAARNYINARRYREALNALSGVAESARTARWYYYSALANWGLGNSITALQHAQRACQMEPGNGEYQQLLSRLQSGGQTYQNASQSYSTPGLSVGRLCLSFWLLNLLCRCFCGFW